MMLFWAVVCGLGLALAAGLAYCLRRRVRVAPLILVSVFLFALILTGCGSNNNTAPAQSKEPATVSIAPNSGNTAARLQVMESKERSVAVGGTASVTIQYSPGIVTADEIEFVISPEGIIEQVDTTSKMIGSLTCNLSAVAEGEVTLYAQVNGGEIKSEEVKITVTAE